MMSLVRLFASLLLGITCFCGMILDSCGKAARTSSASSMLGLLMAASITVFIMISTFSVSAAGLPFSM